MKQNRFAGKISALMIAGGVLAGQVLIGSPTPSATAQTASAPGNAAFVRCAACHSVARGAKGIGPTLFAVSGRAVAGEPSFVYSPALKAKGGVWNDALLDAYIADPRKAVPGTRMAFIGEKDPAKRAALIAYMKTLK